MRKINLYVAATLLLTSVACKKNNTIEVPPGIALTASRMGPGELAAIGRGAFARVLHGTPNAAFTYEIVAGVNGFNRTDSAVNYTRAGVLNSNGQADIVFEPGRNHPLRRYNDGELKLIVRMEGKTISETFVKEEYMINDQEDLINMGYLHGFGPNEHFVQQYDITLDSVFPYAIVPKKFSGTYDGRGNAIKNLRINYMNNGAGLDTLMSSGLFSWSEDAVIRNLTVQYGAGGITSNYTTAYCGGLVGKAVRTKIIECSVEGSMMTGMYGGGIVGLGIRDTMYAVAFRGIIRAKSRYAGGLIGGADSCMISMCYAFFTPDFTKYGGGMIGVGYHISVKDSYSYVTDPTVSLAPVCYESWQTNWVDISRVYSNRYDHPITDPRTTTIEDLSTMASVVTSMEVIEQLGNGAYKVIKPFVASGATDGHMKLYWER